VNPVVRGQMHGRELAEPINLDEAQRIVAVGLALEVLELPGLAGSVGDQAGHPFFCAEVMDSAG